MIRIQEIPMVAERLQAGKVQTGVAMDARTIIQGIERHASLAPGTEDRFTGYAVIGLPFRSGHVLSLRRFPASSVGPGYTSVWHRDPAVCGSGQGRGYLGGHSGRNGGFARHESGGSLAS